MLSWHFNNKGRSLIKDFTKEVVPYSACLLNLVTLQNNKKEFVVRPSVRKVFICTSLFPEGLKGPRMPCKVLGGPAMQSSGFARSWGLRGDEAFMKAVLNVCLM